MQEKVVKSVTIDFADGSHQELTNFFLVGAIEGENQTTFVPLLGYDCTVGTLYEMLDRAAKFVNASIPMAPRKG